MMKHFLIVIGTALTAFCAAQAQDSTVVRELSKREIPKLKRVKHSERPPVDYSTIRDGIGGFFDIGMGYSTVKSDPIGVIARTAVGIGARKDGFSVLLLFGGEALGQHEPLQVHYPAYEGDAQGRRTLPSDIRPMYFVRTDLSYQVLQAQRNTLMIGAGVGYGKREYRTQDGALGIGRYLRQKKESLLLSPYIEVQKWYQGAGYLGLRLSLHLNDFRLNDHHSAPFKGNCLMLSFTFGDLFWKL